jgi:hypothetical protein
VRIRENVDVFDFELTSDQFDACSTPAYAAGLSRSRSPSKTSTDRSPRLELAAEDPSRVGSCGYVRGNQGGRDADQ